MKVCKKCGKEKPLTEFHKHIHMKDEHLSTCKKCKYEYVKIWRKKNPEKANRNSRNYYSNHRKELIKKSIARQKKHPHYGRDLNRKHHPNIKHYEVDSKKPDTLMKRKHRKNNPEKYKARNMITNLLNQKKIVKQPCEVCGEIKVHAHHVDYDKPLKIMWLCQKHHSKIHGHLKGAA